MSDLALLTRLLRLTPTEILAAPVALMARIVKTLKDPDA